MRLRSGPPMRLVEVMTTPGNSGDAPVCPDPVVQAFQDDTVGTLQALERFRRRYEELPAVASEAEGRLTEIVDQAAACSVMIIGGEGCQAILADGDITRCWCRRSRSDGSGRSPGARPGVGPTRKTARC